MSEPTVESPTAPEQTPRTPTEASINTLKKWKNRAWLVGHLTTGTLLGTGIAAGKPLEGAALAGLLAVANNKFQRGMSADIQRAESLSNPQQNQPGTTEKGNK